ncbi:hypothetical protein RFI_21646 [Reticulomyxa filosa]|uniref:Uncharacterized protein n=1 Tax=Reticulomyxa filosa TaxID=46433 RepID=X6MNY8_RETFI|nr:hypothetical protein RFI_21646 [Reticulomyxa filosa]|eukprot:ETO15718.1 hypothetical protein RFI_21646 [Reticulomyxa filosa]
MIKNGGQALIDSVLFNWSFKIGYVPRLWKRANIVPIPKPDRGHSQLLSGIGKLLERIITMRLMWYLNENKSLHYARFQSWHNTSELLLRLTESIYSTFDNNGVSYDVLLDISSAYDSVWRDGLRHKMRYKFRLKERIDKKEMEWQLNQLQKSLDNVSLWASRWKLLLAPDKIQSITFKQKEIPKDESPFKQ